ncbi:MAG: response regulator transcription factor [Bacillota bacterium]|nr:response regulator transcription factor [Bacillota bacterium]
MEDKQRILLVEDDKNILRTNRRILEREGYTVLCAETLDQARKVLQQHTPDVLVLDIMLPDGSGLDFCRRIRPQLSSPVLFLTALGEREEILEGLIAGGNDYITKPYDIDEFVARIKAQLHLVHMNRQAADAPKALKRGPLELDMVAIRAFLGGEDMLLSAREFSLLLYLLQNEGRTLAAEEIYENAWKLPLVGDANALWKCISRLKTKLAPFRKEISLMNFRNKGYSLEIFEADDAPPQSQLRGV